MYHLFPLFGGAIACIMMTINGMMTTAAGSYFSTVVLHIGGLLFLIVLFAVRREKVHLFPADIPWKEYLGGVIGVATVVMNNHAFGGVSVSAMVALALLGQTVSSAVIDQFGLLGMPKRLFRKERLAGYAFMLLGILVMLFPFSGSGSRVSAVLLLLAGGVTVVITRALNGQITERVGVMQATLYNYIMGLVTAILVMLLIGRKEPIWMGTPLPTNPLLYIGGLLGVAVVVLENSSVHRVSAVYMTFLQFLGQVAAGIVVDTMLNGGIVWRNVAGGICIALGLLLNAFIEQRKKQRNHTAEDEFDSIVDPEQMVGDNTSCCNRNK